MVPADADQNKDAKVTTLIITLLSIFVMPTNGNDAKETTMTQHFC